MVPRVCLFTTHSCKRGKIERDVAEHSCLAGHPSGFRAVVPLSRGDVSLSSRVCWLGEGRRASQEAGWITLPLRSWRLWDGLSIQPTGSRLPGSLSSVCPRRMWRHVSNVPMLPFRHLARFRRAHLRHVENVPPHPSGTDSQRFTTAVTSTVTSRRKPAAVRRGHRIDVEAGAPLEAGHARQPRDDLHVPVIVRQQLRVERRRVDDVVVRRLVEGRFQLEQDRLQDRCPALRSRFSECSRNGCCGSSAESTFRRETGWRRGRNATKLGVSSTMRFSAASS